jgi:DNA-binding NarL/FixJ family response regulator
MGVPSLEYTSSFLIVEDHPMFRLGMVTFLKRKFPNSSIREADNISEASHILANYPTDFLLLDLHLGEDKIHPHIPGMLKKHPHTKIIAISFEENPILAIWLLQIGAHGFVAKGEQSFDEILVDCICGKRYYSGLRNNTPINGNGFSKSAVKLSPNELKITSNLLLGKTSSEIGDLLGLSKLTIDTYRKNIKKKLSQNPYISL